MGQRISARDVVATLPDGVQIKFEQLNVRPDTGVAAVTSQGAPDGWVRGENSADGDITLVPEELQKLNDSVAANGGNWEDYPEFDLPLIAVVGGLSYEVTIFGVKLNAPEFAFDATSAEKITHQINFMVTGPDFIHLKLGGTLTRLVRQPS